VGPRTIAFEHFRGTTVPDMPSNRGGASLPRIFSAALAAILASSLVVPQADARDERKTPQKARSAVETPKPLEADGPLLMLISLNQQRMFVYDSNGFVVQTRVSTGMPGFDTPKGIYSILEKQRDHASNIYEGASMPHMQRLLMTGIAMHGGVVPGYPASHGCIRLPFEFARKFFDMTDLNQRVVVMPDVSSPIAFEHPLLFSALPSVASADASPGAKAIKIGVDVADAVIGASSAEAATGPVTRTLESAAQDRIALRQQLVDGIGAAGERRQRAAEAEKAAVQAIADAKSASKAARSKANALDRAADKAKDGIKTAERSVAALEKKIAREGSRMRADELEALRDDLAHAAERIIAPAMAESQRAADAAKAAFADAKAADGAVASALDQLKAAKAETKGAAQAEVAANTAVDKFDKEEANRSFPVSVFISSKTGMVSVRQGFEKVFEMQASIENPEVPLDNFLFTASSWKDHTKTALNWTATEIDENSRGFASFDDGEAGKTRKKGEVAAAPLPPETDAAKAARTLDRIKLPREAADRIAEVVKPGSTMIVSSYDVAKSETRYRGTDFIVQMPEVVAKITRPKPKPKIEDDDDDYEGGFFFFSAPKSPPVYKRKTRVGSSKSSVW